MRLIRFAPCLAVLFALALFSATSSTSAQDKKGKKNAPLKPINIAKVERPNLVDFEKDILPILERSCTACHSSALDENGLILETPAAILKGGKRGPAAVAGKGTESLMLVLAAHQKDPAMPPPENDVEAPMLKPEELGLIKLWIDQGATGTVSGKSKTVAWQPLPAGVNPIFAVALSPDGQFVAAGRANQIFIYHVPTGQLVTRLTDNKLASDKRGVAHLDLVQSLAFNPAGDLLASGAFREVKLWRRPTNVKKFHLAEASTAEVRAVAASPDGKFLATGGAEGIKLWNLADGKPAKTIAGHTGPVTSLAFSADSTKLYSGSLDKSLRVWNAADGAAAGRIDTPAAVNSLALYNKGTQVVSGGADNLIRLWNAPAAATALADVAGPVTRGAASGDKKWFALAAADGKIALVDVAAKKVARTFAGHPGGVAALSFNNVSNRLVSTGADGLTRIWDPGADQPVLTLSGAGVATAVALNGTANQAVTGTAEGRLAIWKLDAAAPRALGGDNGSPATASATSRDGKLLATAGTADGKPAVLVREVASGNVTKTLIGHEGPVTAVAFSGDAQKVISGSADKTARVWNLGDGKELSKFAHGNTVTAVALASDGNTAVSGSADNSLKSWTSADGKEAKNFAGHAGAVVGVAFTSNNQQVVSASADKTVRVWNPADGAQVRAIDVTQPATCLALSKDDQRVAVGAGDKSVRLFQVADAKPLAVLAGLSENPLAVTFSPSNARVLSVDAKQAIVWDAATGARLEILAGPAALASGVFAADENTCVLAGGDKSLAAVTLKIERLAGDHAKKITGLVYNAEGSSFYTASEDGTVRGFSSKDGQQKFNANHAAPVHALAVSADGKLLATAGEDKQIKVWTKDGQPSPKPNLGPFAGPVKSVAFSPDSVRLVGSAGPEVLVFHVADGVAEQGISEHAAPVEAVLISGEKNDLILTASADKTVKLSGLAAAGRIAGHTGPVNSVAVFSDTQILSGSEDGTVKQWEGLKPQPTRNMSHGAPVTSVAVRPDAQRFASASANNTIRLWNAQNGQQVAEMKGDIRAQRVQALAERDVNAGKGKQKAQQDQLAAAEKDIPVKTEAAKKTGEAKATAEKNFTEKQAASKTADDAKMAAEKASEEKAKVAREAVAAQKGAEDAAKKTAEDFKAATKKAEEAKAAADKDKDKKELAEAAEAAKKAAEAADAGNKAAAEAKTKADAALADANKQAKEAADKVMPTVKPADDAKKALGDAEAAKKKAEKDHADAEAQIKKATDLVPKIKTDLAAADAELKTFEGALEATKKAAAELEKPIRTLAFSADNAQLVSGGDNKTVYTWNATDGSAIDSFTGHAAPVLAVAFGPANTIVSAGADKSATVWELSPAWNLERTLGLVDGDYNDPKNFVDRVLALDFSPDGQFLATGGGEPSRSGELKLWKVGDGSLVGRFPDFANQKPDKGDAHSDTIFGIDFSADGKTIASCGADKFVKTFNVADGKFLRSFEGHTHHVLGVSWQSNGKVLASSGADNVIKVWNVETGEQQRTIQGFQKQVTSVQFIGDSPEMLSACGDKTIRRTRANDGGNVRQFAGGTDFMYSAASTPNGKVIVAGGHDSVLRVWNGDSGQTIVNFDPPKEAPKQ